MALQFKGIKAMLRHPIRVLYVLLITVSLMYVILHLKWRFDVKAAVIAIPKPRMAQAVAHLTSRPRSTSAALKVPRIPTSGRSTNKSTFWITAGVIGRLGNQMFQYASLLGIAAMNNMTPFYSSRLLPSFFTVSHIHDWSRSHFTTVSEKDFASYDLKFAHLRQTNTTIWRYLQSWKYFRFIRDIIMKEFTFKEHIQLAAARILDKHSLEMSNRTRVGIHVRLKDMARSSMLGHGYHIAPASYVRQAMGYMRQKHPDVIFLLVTDDVGWCRNNLNASDLIVVDSAPAKVHLSLLASCDHVIMTVGTFGWWGGYLSGGEVVYYWDPAQMLHHPPLKVEIKHPEDFFLPDWVPLSGL